MAGKSRSSTAERLRSYDCAELTAYHFQMNTKKRGRKPLTPGEPMKRKVVTMDEMTLRKLRVLGDGNISQGVRRAAEVAFDRYQK